MESEASLFESNETLAEFLVSTPLLEESWKLCCLIFNTAPESRFTVHRVHGTAYVAFSDCHFDVGKGNNSNLVALSSVPGGLFSALCRDGDPPSPPSVHAGLLNLFLSVYDDILFRDQMLEIMNTSKSIVLTGHSAGGSIASLLAIWLLSHLETIGSVMCITFGSPMLGNESFSQAILQERWAGHFCHVVSEHDIVPRLLFAPSIPLDQNKTRLFQTVLASLDQILSKGHECCRSTSFWPFATYLFCTNKGALCVDNGMAIVKLLYLTLRGGTPSSCLEDHLRYTDHIQKLHWQFIKSRSFLEGNLIESSYEAGVTLALESLGIASNESSSGDAKEVLKMAKRLGRTRNLNSAHLAIGLSKINPLRAQIEWYKASSDKCDDQMGYYDSFKRRGASKRDFKVNMNRIKLAQFWDSVIDKLETNQLPYDFHKREKWVNASQFYKLLLEPLDIAEYYRSGMHHEKGHYMQHGRERRYKVFDNWWSELGNVSNGTDTTSNTARSRFASLTQDSCFWARVEEARDMLIKVRSERDACRMLEDIHKFDQYARRLIDNKAVSPDVLAKNSSYTLFIQEWKELKSQLQLIQPWFTGIDARMVP